MTATTPPTKTIVELPIDELRPDPANTKQSLALDRNERRRPSRHRTYGHASTVGCRQ